MTLIHRFFQTHEVRPVPDLLLQTDHMWVVAGERGAVSFDTAMMFEAEINGEKVKQWGDGFIRLHRPRCAVPEAVEGVTAFTDPACQILELECWDSPAEESGWDLKLAWQAANLDDEVIYAELERIYQKWA